MEHLAAIKFQHHFFEGPMVDWTDWTVPYLSRKKKNVLGIGESSDFMPITFNLIQVFSRAVSIRQNHAILAILILSHAKDVCLWTHTATRALKSQQNPSKSRQESEASYEDPEEAKLKVEAQASNRIHGIGIFSSYIYHKL